MSVHDTRPVMIDGIAIRAALVLAIYGQAMFFLAAIGQLRPVPIIAVTLVAIAAMWRRRPRRRTSETPSGAAARRPLIRPSDTFSPRGREKELHRPLAPRERGEGGRRPGEGPHVLLLLVFVPLLVLAFYPPIAFDETLYHLPFVRAFARDGALRFLPDLRFPVFPQIHELLCVPAYLLAGDVATHLVALLEVIITAALLIDWGRRHNARAGTLAAAIFLGSPIVIHLATILYVEAALTLFVAAGFYCIDRERFALAGFFFGTACSVKYLGAYFAVAGLLLMKLRWRAILGFLLGALPTTAWIFIKTGSPVFPFFPNNLWRLPRTPPVLPIRVLWDATFSRSRLNSQPPMTPLLIGLVLLIVAAAIRNVKARIVAFMSAGYLIIFAFLPQDSRYLVPLLPLVSVAAAMIIASRWPKIVTIATIVAIAPGIAYAGYRIALQGMPPATPAAREAWLTKRVPEYRALMRAGNERVYVCGAEQLKGLARGELLGDFIGPWSYDRILPNMPESLRRIGVGYLLVSKRKCAAPRGMHLIYEDEAAELWR
jgi:hypothetical protein